MKFLTLFKIILISNVYILYGYTEKIGDSPSDRYEHVVNKSIGYIQFFFSLLNELEDLKGTIHDLICNIDQKVRNLESRQEGRKVSGIQKILNRLEFLSKRLQDQIDDWEDKLVQESITISLDNNSKVKVGDYKNTIKNLIRLYGYVVKLITKFNTLKDQTERHIENVSHDISNINTSMADKEETTKEINNATVKLTRELKGLTKDILNEIINCKKQLEDINQKNEQLSKVIPVSNDTEKVESNNIEDNNNKEQEDSNKEKSSEDKNKEDNNSKEKEEDNKKKEENNNKKETNKQESTKLESKNSEKVEDNKSKDKKSSNSKSKKEEKTNYKVQDNKNNNSESKSNKADNKKIEKSKTTKKEDKTNKNDEVSIDDLTEEDIINYFRTKKSTHNVNAVDKDNNKKDNEKDDVANKIDKNIRDILTNIKTYKENNTTDKNNKNKEK